MFGILQSQAPAKQTATDAISILSNRLLNGRLLEDRRAAILGLRSFAKEYPASVASGALRSLIGSLSTDGSDVDTVKIVLETLLMLFSPNKNSVGRAQVICMKMIVSADQIWLSSPKRQKSYRSGLLTSSLKYGHDIYIAQLDQVSY